MRAKRGKRKDMFDVGDYVVIRDWDEMAEEFGVVGQPDDRQIKCHCCFTEEMRRFCGMEFTIERIESDGQVFPVEKGVFGGYWLSTDMIKPVEIEYDEEGISTYLSEIKVV